MQKDGLLTLADDQSVAGLSSGLFEHVVDQGAAMDLANGNQLFGVFTVKTTFTGGADEAVVFRVVYNSDDSPAIANNFFNPLLGQSSAVPISELTAGKQIVVALSPWSFSTSDLLEYTASNLARRYITGAWFSYDQVDLIAGTFTLDALVAGTFDMHLTRENPRGQKFYPRSTLSDGNVVKFG